MIVDVLFMLLLPLLVDPSSEDVLPADVILGIVIYVDSRFFYLKMPFDPLYDDSFHTRGCQLLCE